MGRLRRLDAGCVFRVGIVFAQCTPAHTSAVTLDKLDVMDRVRLGRAIGYGTRHAARTVAAVVEAANASPSSAASQPKNPQSRGCSEPITPGSHGTSPRPAQLPGRVRTPQVQRGLKHLRHSVWGPLAVFSGALWLRVTGLFFAMIAFTVGAGAWRLRGGWKSASQTSAGMRFWLFAGVAGVFAYFAVSSFVRANLKERRAATGRTN